MERQIVALGGGGFSDREDAPLDDFVLGLAGTARPRVCFLPTASAESADYVVAFYEAFRERAEPTHLELFGGNTANMLAIWTVHGVDAILREAWERGIVLAGSSAGSICWFEAGVTDSFGDELAPLRCLGFLPGSNCPHYDSEPQRRPTYRRLVEAGELPPGLAAEDGVGLHFVGTELAEAVAARPNAGAFRVEPGAEVAIPVRRLG